MAKVSVPSFKKGKNFATFLFGETVLKKPMKNTKYLIALPGSKTSYVPNGENRIFKALIVWVDNMFVGKNSLISEEIKPMTQKLKTSHNVSMGQTYSSVQSTFGKNNNVGNIKSGHTYIGAGTKTGDITSVGDYLYVGKGAEVKNIFARNWAYIDGASAGDIHAENIHVRNTGKTGNLFIHHAAIVEKDCTTGNIMAGQLEIDKNAITGKVELQPKISFDIPFED